jgi:hypothetical protein
VATADNTSLDDPDIANAVATIRVVPEPSSIVLLLIGLGMMGCALRKRR